MNLRERIEAEIERREKAAQSATPGPWLYVDYSDPPGQPMTSEGLPSTFMGCGSVITMGEDVAGGDIAAPNGDLYPRSGYSPAEDMAHIALHDPADALRRYAHYRRVLERHVHERERIQGDRFHPLTGEPLPPEYETTCEICGWVGVNDNPNAACPEVCDIAEALGISDGSADVPP